MTFWRYCLKSFQLDFEYDDERLIFGESTIISEKFAPDGDQRLGDLSERAALRNQVHSDWLTAARAGRQDRQRSGNFGARFSTQHRGIADPARRADQTHL
jgi:hypothetical protein